MSYPGLDPADMQEKTNPVGTQVLSAGDTPTPNSLLSKVSEDMHEAVLRDTSFDKKLNDAVQEAVSDMFALKPNWSPTKQKVNFVINCPSGQKVLAKHLNTMDLLEADLVEEIDFFTKRLFPQDMDPSGNPIDEDEEDTEASIWTVLRDIKKRKRFIELLNRLIELSIEKPSVINDGIEIATDSNGKQFLITGAEMSEADYVKVYGHPLQKLVENQTYCSAIDFTDKMVIFGELNKPLSVIQPFRQEQAVGLASMEPGQGTRVAP